MLAMMARAMVVVLARSTATTLTIDDWGDDACHRHGHSIDRHLTNILFIIVVANNEILVMATVVAMVINTIVTTIRERLESTREAQRR